MLSACTSSRYLGLTAISPETRAVNDFCLPFWAIVLVFLLVTIIYVITNEKQGGPR